MLNYKPLQIISLSIITAALMLGCSSDDGDSTPSAQTQTPGSLVGYLVDSPIEGLHYVCGTRSGTTGAGGHFSCDTMPVSFKVGNYTVGSIQNIPADSNVYPQDLLGLDRNNTTNIRLVELVQFLQALDDDGNISTAIVITEQRHAEFEEVDNDGGSGGGSGEGNVSPSEAGESAGLPLPSPTSAMDHLRKSIAPQDYQHADTSDLSAYMGSWAGGGWGWEVRFKQSSGAFTSNFFGIDESELPFDGEKTIMSLMVTHKTAFTFSVDSNGQVQGEGDIVYDLLPNLCGLNALVNDMNTFVGFFDKIFTLGSIAGANGAIKEIKFGSGLMKNLLQFANTNNSFAGKDWISIMGDYAKKAYTNTQQNNNICNAVTTDARVAGGLRVGPASVEELLYNGGIDFIKARFSIDSANPILSFISATASLILSVPGLTQIQYSYKGLVNGAETRHFSFSGNIDANGKLFLKMDNIDGSDELEGEYTVNWQTDRFTFPAWSPFLQEGATVYPGDRNFTIYDYETVNVDHTYTDYDPAGFSSQETVSVPTPTLTAQSVYRALPMAIFKASGTHRNDVSVWQEYEYEWNAYKLSE